MFGFAALAAAALAAASARDARSPTISSIRVGNVTLVSAEVSWLTDVPATSQVILVSSEHEPFRRAPEPQDTNRTTTHRVVLYDLLPNTTYWFYVASVDSNEGLATSYDPSSRASFQTLPVDPKAPFDYRLDAQGALSVYVGHDLYIEMTMVGLGGALGHLHFNGADGLPPGATAGMLCDYNSKPQNDFRDSMCWVNPGNYRTTQVIRLGIPLNARVGSYYAILAFMDNGVPKRVDYPFNVLPMPQPVVKARIVSVPRIPGLEKWKQTMTDLGRKWCQPSAAMNFGWEPQIWYYDGGRTYLQIADYTRDYDTWYPCAFNIINQYRDRVIARNGYYEGWRVFPHGLAMSYWRTGDVQARQAAILLSQASAYARAGGRVNTAAMRETAYIIDAYVKAEQLGEPHSPYLARAADFALGMFDQLFVSDQPIYQQTFYDGLMAEALIQYYELTQDTRVPPAIKAMLDWLWDNAYSARVHALAYNPLEVPPHYELVMSNLVIPAFAWYWQLTGDPLYQQRGDDLFAHALDSDISYSGKIFNQNYRWSFDYVRWRSNDPTSTTEPSANTPDSTPRRSRPENKRKTAN
jgi:hypothetical protein